MNWIKKKPFCIRNECGKSTRSCAWDRRQTSSRSVSGYCGDNHYGILSASDQKNSRCPTFDRNRGKSEISISFQTFQIRLIAHRSSRTCDHSLSRRSSEKKKKRKTIDYRRRKNRGKPTRERTELQRPDNVQVGSGDPASQNQPTATGKCAEKPPLQRSNQEN